MIRPKYKIGDVIKFKYKDHDPEVFMISRIAIEISNLKSYVRYSSKESVGKSTQEEDIVSIYVEKPIKGK